jgi:4-hydroxyproline epimerase
MTQQTLSDRIEVVDSHTGGEPTRVVLSGGPDLAGLPPAACREVLRTACDHFRSAVVNEPRGSDALVGALLCAPTIPRCTAGVVFFNNVGYLGMCVHGTIGLLETLAYLGRISTGTHLIETPVGIVSAVLYADGTVSVQNVPSYRYAAGVVVSVPDYGMVRGDVAWGGNWFFLVERHQERIALDNVDRLTQVAGRIRRALDAAGVVGADGAAVDHVELFAPPAGSAADSRNFVLCPGGVYDRSPCGTGTSAKVACLIADGKLRPGRLWRQESIVGSIFHTVGRLVDGGVVCVVKGSAHITARATLLYSDRDPYRTGIRT